MYSKEQYRTVLALFDKCGSVTKVIMQLGYPVRRQTLYNWIARRKHLPSGHSTFRLVNTAEHPRHPARRYFELREDVQSVSDEIGYSKASIYQWRRTYVAHMQLEIAILKVTLDVLKKDSGVNQSALKNREKAAMIDALKNKYPLPTMLKALCYARSSYFYRKNAKNKATCMPTPRNKSEQFLRKTTRVMDIAEYIWHSRKTVLAVQRR